eukprot:10824385-Alexandrium_andersonii.AAC.1
MPWPPASSPPTLPLGARGDPPEHLRVRVLLVWRSAGLSPASEHRGPNQSSTHFGRLWPSR